MKTTRTITKETPNGKFEFIVTAEKRVSIIDRDLDGYKYEEKIYINKKNIEVELNGKKVCDSRSITKMGTYSSIEKNYPEQTRKAYGYLTSNFGLSEQTYNELTAAMTECVAEVTTPETMERERKDAEKEAKISAKYAAEEAAYKKNIASGMCPKCGTWCYGDCTAN